ncbi:putative indolepyruvate oxidoreductase subunit B [compost metagenome]
MAYDDVIRVADLKTRGTRFERVRNEVGARPDQLVMTIDYMHPRLEEICGTLPTGLGRWLENSKSFGGFVERRLGKGRLMQSGTLSGFLMLYSLAGMRRFRRRTLRHQIEAEGLRQWLDLITRLVPRDYALAVETVNCRRLVKGYSDTHVRGDGKYRQLLAAAEQLVGRPDAAASLRALRDTALADEKCGPMERQLAEKLAA